MDESNDCFHKLKMKYDNVPAEKTLYHFTSANGLYAILRSMSLRTSDFSNLNDMNEANINNFYISEINKRFDVEKFIKEHCRTISFAKNTKNNSGIFDGINHPAMWAHYSQNTLGACIVLDRDKFEKANSLIKSDKIKFQNINYEDSYDQILKQTDNVEDLVVQNLDKIFFVKHTNWQYEDEIRLCGVDLQEFLDISTSVRYICLGKSFTEEQDETHTSYMRKLNEVINYKENKCYGIVTKESFCRQYPMTWGYDVVDDFIWQE